jgi:hypothetical protein
MLQCVYLDEHHPLKVLCSLELAAHERSSQGLLPNRRRTRGARPGIKTVSDDSDSDLQSLLSTISAFTA